MSFIVMVFTCVVGIYGQDCKPWQEERIPHYSTYQECERKARALADNIKAAGPARWRMQLPTDKYQVQIKAFCIIPIIDEVTMG